MDEKTEWTLSKMARKADANAEAGLNWIDRGKADVAIAYMLYALVLAVLSIAEQMVKQDR